MRRVLVHFQSGSEVLLEVEEEEDLSSLLDQLADYEGGPVEARGRIWRPIPDLIPQAWMKFRVIPGYVEWMAFMDDQPEEE